MKKASLATILVLAPFAQQAFGFPVASEILASENGMKNVAVRSDEGLDTLPVEYSKARSLDDSNLEIEAECPTDPDTLRARASDTQPGVIKTKCPACPTCNAK